MLPAKRGLPEGFSTRAPTREDAEEVAILISACQIADTGETDMSVEEMHDDWHSFDLAEEAVIVTSPDGRTAVYADVFNRSFVIVSIYGYVHPDYRGMGLGSYLVAWGERWTRDHMPQAQENARASSRSITSTQPTKQRDACWRTQATPRCGGYT